MSKIDSVLAAVDEYQQWFGEERPTSTLVAVIQAGDNIRTGCPGLGRDLMQRSEDLSLTSAWHYLKQEKMAPT